MLRLAPYFAGGFAACLVMDFVGSPTTLINNFLSPSMASPAAVVANSVDRAHKGDRLAMPARADADIPVIAAVELVGLRDTAIVYRDRSGRVLFQSDPLSNATLIAKGVALPEVTIRDHGGAAVKPVPVENAKQPAAKGSKVPVGCDPAFSPLANAAIANFAGRCVS